MTDTTITVLIANAAASLAAYNLADCWLRDYVFRITLWAEIFLLPGAVTLALAIAPVSIRAVRTASLNPVTVLRQI